MSESELATLGTYETSIDTDSDRYSTRSDGQSRIVMSDCESGDFNEAAPGDPIFISKPSTSTATSSAAPVMDSHTSDIPPHEANSLMEQLETAVYADDTAKVDELLKVDPSLLNKGALHRAAGNNMWRMCNFLLAKHALVNEKAEPQLATPLLWACSRGHAYIVKLLLEHGAAIDVVDSCGFTPLHLAVHSSNILMVAYILHLEVEVDKLDFGDRSALHWACVQGDFLTVEALLKAGSSPNLPDGEGTLPLCHAVYTSKSDAIVELLLQFGADPAPIAQMGDALANPVWKEGCLEAGRTNTGQVRRSAVMSPELAKAVTAVAPTVVIPLALGMMYVLPTSIWAPGIPLGVALAYAAKKILDKHVIPFCWFGPRATLQSTLLAGVFCAVLVWDTFFWFTRMFSTVGYKQPLLSLLMLLDLGVVVWSYLTTCWLDPGKIEPKSTTLRLKAMNELMDLGLFDSVHLCTHTYVQKPFRSRYDHYLDRVICRYDHYCPWMYNVVGLRNHRVFVIFLFALSALITGAGIQYAAYCREVGSSAFSNGLTVLTLFQAFWLAVLTLVQCAQIAKGVTSFEIMAQGTFDVFRTDPVKAYSSLPRDHPKANEIFLDRNSEAGASLRRHAHAGCHNHAYPTWMRLTGISQCLMVLNGVRTPMSGRSTRESAMRNCADFWCTGESLWRPQGGAGRFGGKRIDYYTQTDVPTVSSESDTLV